MSEDRPGEGGEQGRPALWAGIAGAGDSLEEYAQNWLTLQASMIASALQAVLVMRGEADDAFTPVAFWSATADSDGERLAEVSERALQEGRPLLTELAAPPGAGQADKAAKGGSHRYAIACPLIFDDRLHGVAALEAAVSLGRRAQVRYGASPMGNPASGAFFSKAADAGERRRHLAPSLCHRPARRGPLRGKLRSGVHDLRHGHRRPSRLRQGEPWLCEAT